MNSSLWARLRGYPANADPVTAVANTIAMVIAGNQPFYPLYVYAIAGDRAWPALATWLSTPLFLAVPAVARRNRLYGKILLCFAGVANTVLSNVVLGGVTGIPLFYIPCAVLCLTLFGKGETKVGLSLAALTALPAITLLRLPPWFGAFAPAQTRSLQHVHEFSVASLMIFMTFVLGRALRQPKIL